MVLNKISQSVLQKSRKASLQALSAFNAVAPQHCAVNFTAEDSAEGKVQFQAFLKRYLLPHALWRRLYPAKNGAGDIQAETAALQARLDAVLERPSAISGL